MDPSARGTRTRPPLDPAAPYPPTAPRPVPERDRPPVIHPTHRRSPREDGVEANARLTGSIGALLLVLLAIEGVTLLGLQSLLTLHVIIGAVIIPVVGLKLATTTWRFARYYAGDARYRRKGPPPIILRLLGPIVGSTTIALLATGVAALLLGPGTWRSWMLLLHKASFVVWFGAMTIHVLGHLCETGRLAAADWLPSKLLDRLGRHRPAVVLGTGIRRTVLVIATLLGVVLAIALSGYAAGWFPGAGALHP